MNFPQGATTPGHTDIHDQIRSQPCQVERNDSSVGELVPSPSVQDAGRVSEVQPSPNSILQSSSNLDINGGQFISSGGAHVTVTINANHIPVDGTRDLHQYTNPSTHPEERHQDVASSQATRANSGTGTRDLPVQKSCDVYYRHLAVKGRGYPLWIPEPNNQLPPIYQRQGIAVGDVGIITPSGSFDFLFNICLPRDHPVNSSEVPDDFTPVNPPLGGRDIRVHQEFRHGSYVASGSIKRSLLQGGDSPGLTFETSASEGALLTMPDGATSSDLRNISRFRHYASANAESWYRFANGPLGCEAKNGDIRLVVGCDKATAWGMATFSNLTEQNDFRLKFKSTTQNSSDPMYYWEYSGSADVRAGPDSWEIEVLRRDDPDRPITYKNQCLFIRTLNPTLREDVWSKLSCDLGALYIQDDLSHATSSLFPPATCIGSTKPSVPPRDDHGPDVPFYSEGTARSVLISESPVAMTAHPSKIINETLLNLNSQAKIVITEDRDWLSVITEDDLTLPLAEDIVARVLAAHEICEEEGVVFLQPKDQMTQSKAKIPELYESHVPPPYISLLNPSLSLSPSTHTVATLASLSPVPGLSTGISLLRATYAGIENVKLYKQQCGDMGGRCVNLMLALRDSYRGLEGSKVQEIADEIESIIMRMHRKVKEWGSWNQLKSFLHQGEIKDGIDRLHRDIDGAMMKFNIQVNMEMTRGQLESKAIQERDKAEIRDLLQVIVKSNEDMKALLTMQPSRDSRPVEEMMESLQTELMNPSLEPIEEEVFKAGLWELHQKTSKLPPLTDLSGQVTLSSQSTIAKGSFNDIFRGRWLDREPVALRLPRTLANSPEVQYRFQREVSIWRELDHPNVVPLYGVTYIGEDLYSVSPWMDNGTAVSYVKKFPTVDRLKLLTDAAFGLEYLHNRGIVHGDLRGANVLISQDGTARLSDFGLSKILEDCGKGMTTSHSLNPRWFAPELLQQTGPSSTHSDVWSFGMICLEILSGEIPFRNFSRDIVVLRELDNGKLPDHPGRIATLQGLSDDMWALMRRCWQKKPESRPPISDVKTSILAIRGIRSGIDSRPTSSLIKHSGSRPSTSSETSAVSSISGQRLRSPLIPSNETEEIDQLSPLALSPSPGFLTGSIERRNGRHKSVSSTGPSFHTELDRRPNSSLPFSPRALSISYSSPPTLEVPHLSSPLPTPHSIHFPTDTHDGSTPSPIRSIISSDSGIQVTGPIREAVTDTRIIVNVTESGVVSSGTLAGLVQRLITNFDSRKDIEYRDVLLTACADFTTPEDLFRTLSRHFYEAESNAEAHPDGRVALQYNVFMVITYWLSNRHLLVDHQLLWQMKTFCESAIRMKSSVTMSDKARDLLKLIEHWARNDTLPPPLSPGRRTLQASEIKPNDLAIALTLYEGDIYKDLVPSDYIAHLRRYPGYNAVEGTYTTNNKIVFWVKDSILHYDGVEQRTEILKFFIHTAQECQKLRNFSSLVAIASALHSAPIERLKLTRSALTVHMQRRLQALDDIINPSSNHRGYREALNDATSSQERDCCIPWLAVHLKELHLVLQKHPTIVQVNGRPLINFQRYIDFMDRVKEVVHYKPPNLEQYRQQGQLDYLINQLQKLKMTPTSDDELMARSKFLEARETLNYKTRRSQLKTLGFKTS